VTDNVRVSLAGLVAIIAFITTAHAYGNEDYRLFLIAVVAGVGICAALLVPLRWRKESTQDHRDPP
jgi:hypothetical protein